MPETDDAQDPAADPIPQPPESAAPPAGAGRARRRRILAVLAPVVALVLGVLVWAGWQWWAFGSSLLGLRDVVGVAQTHVAAGDLTALGGDLARVRELAAAAAAAADTPAVALAQGLPWIGDDVTVARELAAVSADLGAATTGVDPLLERLAHAGGLDLQIAVEARELAGQLVPATQAAAARVAALDTSGLALPIGDDIQRLADALGALGPTVDALSPYLDALAIMATPGAERTWFVVLQNLGESRPSGGMLGGWLLLKTSDAGLEVLDAGSNNELHLEATVDYEGFLPEGYEQVFGDSMSDWRSLNLSAHFPDNARLFAHAWNARGRQQADGVLALGQGSVGSLAALVGPVEVGGRRIAPAGLADYLSVGIYQDYPDPDAKDQAVAELAAQILGRLSSGRFDLSGLLAATAGEPTADYLQLWSADPGVQQRIEAAGLSGGLPDEPGHTASVRLANAGANKLDSFVHLAAGYRLGECAVDDGGIASRASTMTITLRNDVPAGLPDYVTGNGDLLDGLSHPAGATRDFVIVHPPVEATVTSATRDGLPAFVQSAWVRQRQMLVFDVALDPGQATTIELGFDELPTDSEDREFPPTPRILLPPLANPAQVSVVEGPPCR